MKKSRFAIPRVLIGTVLGAGFVFTLVTAAQTLGFGTNLAGVASFTTSTSLLADLSARYFGGWTGDLFDALAICSALGGALAAIVAASRIFVVLFWDLAPSNPVGRISQGERHAPQCRRRYSGGGDRLVLPPYAHCFWCFGIGRVLLEK